MWASTILNLFVSLLSNDAYVPVATCYRHQQAAGKDPVYVGRGVWSEENNAENNFKIRP